MAAGHPPAPVSSKSHGRRARHRAARQKVDARPIEQPKLWSKGCRARPAVWLASTDHLLGFGYPVALIYFAKITPLRRLDYLITQFRSILKSGTSASDRYIPSPLPPDEINGAPEGSKSILDERYEVSKSNNRCSSPSAMPRRANRSAAASSPPISRPLKKWSIEFALCLCLISEIFDEPAQQNRALVGFVRRAW